LEIPRYASDTCITRNDKNLMREVLFMDNLNSKNKSFYITLAITLALMFGVGCLPPVASITPVGMKILGVFLGCIFAWIRGEIIWAGILTIFLLPAYGISTVPAQFASAFGNNNIATAMACMVFCHVFQTCGLMTELARWLTSSKIAQKGKYWLLTMFLITSFILSAFAQQAISSVLILWALFYETAKQIGAKPYEPFTVCSLISIVITGCAGVAVVPFGYFTICGLGIVQNYDPSITNTYFVQHFLTVFLFAVIYIPVLIAFLKFVIQPKTSAEFVAREPYPLIFTSAQKKALFFLAAMTIVMVVPNLCAADTFLYQLFVGKLGTLGILLATCVIMMMTREDGKPLLDIGAALNNMQWELIVLMGSALALCNLMTMDEAGIMQTLIALFTPILGSVGKVGFIVLFGLIVLIMTNCINDFVSLTIMLPIGCSFFVPMGGNSALLLAIAVTASMQGCFMPSGSVQGAMMHGNKEWMHSKDVYKYVLILELVFAACLALTAWIGTVIF